MSSVLNPLSFDAQFAFQPLWARGPASETDLFSHFSAVHSGIVVLKRAGQLGFALIPEDEDALESTLKMAERYRGVKNVVVFGIGGSALGLKSLDLALRLILPESAPKLHIIDNLDEETHAALAKNISARNSLFIFISKSGETTETLTQWIFANAAFKNLNSENTVIITDPEKGILRKIATDLDLPTLPVPPAVGGRFSIFTPVGLFPLAVCGFPVDVILHGARVQEDSTHQNELARHPAALLAALLHESFLKQGVRDLVMMPYIDRLERFADWTAQLIAESLGKSTKLDGNPVAYPVTVLKTLGATDQHSQLQLFLDGVDRKFVVFIKTASRDKVRLPVSEKLNEKFSFLAGKSMAEILEVERQATEQALCDKGKPSVCLDLGGMGPFQMGQLYQFFMNVTAYWGAMMGLNPYDQPAVEAIKKLTFAGLGRKEFAAETKLTEHSDRFVYR